MSETDCTNACIEQQQMAPIGAVGPAADDRDAAGRFARGNRASLVVGNRSAAFWASQESARRAIVTAIVSDAGHALDDAPPRALVAAAEGIAQALLIRDSAFTRLVESGGPLTSAGRTRRAFAVWLAAMDRVERQLRLVGLRRVPRSTEHRSIADVLAAHDGEPADGGDSHTKGLDSNAHR